MIVTIYSTCQGEGIKHYLGYYFNIQNIIVIHNYSMVKNKEIININLLKNTDIFIYQDMPSKWGIYSTDENIKNNILSYLKKECIKISIPYVYCDWLWSVGKMIIRDSTIDFDDISKETELNPKYINKDYIQKLKINKSLKDILDLYDNNELDFDYENRKINSINILKKKEENCMVKISNFILENHTKKDLFLTHNHPTYIILKEMTKQILNILKIKHDDFDVKTLDDNYEIHPYRLVHSKYDIKYFNFEFSCKIDDEKIKTCISEMYSI